MRTNSLSRRSRVSRIILWSIIGVVGLQFFSSNRTPLTHAQLALTVTPTTLDDPARVQRYQQMISPERLASHLHLLASDLFEGRETTTRGQKLAAQYLAAQYRLMGLQPKGTTGAPQDAPESYFQPFNVYRVTPEETELEVLSHGRKLSSSSFSSRRHDDLSYFLTGDIRDTSGGVVFAGYGIGDDKLGYNDFAALKSKGISIDGKWVMILDDEPALNATTSLLPTDGHKLSKWSSAIPKRVALLGAGKPAGVLEVVLPGPFLKGTFADLSTAASQNAQRLGAISLFEDRDFPPTFAISASLANQILAGSGKKIEDLRRQIDSTLKPSVFELPDTTVKATMRRSSTLSTENVLAFIEGSDPKLKDEVVIVSAHYDHLGLNPLLKGDQIFNGAADDGSGTVACLELAQAFMTAKREGFGPRRSLLFINFSAEEKRTLGSAMYANSHPVIPLDQTVADVNMDGVGGIDANHPTHSRNYVYVIGTDELSRELLDVNHRVKDATRIDLELTMGKNFPSDQRSFQAQLVPFIYYSTGLIEHYHTVSDESKTIDYNHLARVTQLVFGTVWQLANQDQRPQRIDRSKLSVVGYVCPPCGLECDDRLFDHAGVCPFCGMPLVPKFQGPGLR